MEAGGGGVGGGSGFGLKCYWLYDELRFTDHTVYTTVYKRVYK